MGTNAFNVLFLYILIMLIRDVNPVHKVKFTIKYVNSAKVVPGKNHISWIIIAIIALKIRILMKIKSNVSSVKQIKFTTQQPKDVSVVMISIGMGIHVFTATTLNTSITKT